MNRFNKIIAILISVLSLNSLLGSQVYANTNLTENVGNGAGSLNSVTATSFTSTVLDLRNRNISDNKVVTTSDSGNNVVNRNIDGGDISTGDSDSKTSIQNTASSNTVTLPCNCEEQDNIAVNKGNGEQSTNIAASDSVNLNTILLDNVNKNKNNAITRALSGRNKAKKNIGGGSITTGDTKSQTEITNPGSENKVVSTDGDSGDGNRNIAENLDNGTKSLNSAAATSFDSLTLDLANKNNSKNTAKTIADSGQNKSNKNVGGGEIATGNADARAKIVGALIKNLVDLSCDCGQDNKAKSRGNGAESVNLLSANSTLLRNALLDNLNKEKNNTLTKAKSGRNNANNNVGSGGVSTGNNNSFTNIESGLILNRFNL